MPYRAEEIKPGSITLAGPETYFQVISGHDTLEPTYAAWQKLPDNALGHALFSVGMCIRVPYFGSVLPRVVEMRPGRCEVRAQVVGRPQPPGTFHAIAACNLAEAAMGMLSERPCRRPTGGSRSR